MKLKRRVKLPSTNKWWRFKPKTCLFDINWLLLKSELDYKILLSANSFRSTVRTGTKFTIVPSFVAILQTNCRSRCLKFNRSKVLLCFGWNFTFWVNFLYFSSCTKCYLNTRWLLGWKLLQCSQTDVSLLPMFQKYVLVFKLFYYLILFQ